MTNLTTKIKDGALFGIGLVGIVGLTCISYASFTWLTQTNVSVGDNLTASKWNNMLNNQNFLKQELEGQVSKLGDTIEGELNMANNKITNIGVPTESGDVTSKAYVDSVGAATAGGVVFTIRGDNTCPTGYTLLYTGEAATQVGGYVYSSQFYGVSGTTICKKGGIANNNTQTYVNSYWISGTSYESSEEVNCAVCAG